MVKVILLVTSANKMGDTDNKTGWYLPEVAHPYEKFKKAGYEIVFASPKGGLTDADPGGVKAYLKDEVCVKFQKSFLNEKNQLRTRCMKELKPQEYDIIFYAGGHGTMYDFPDDKVNNEAARIIYEKGGIVAAVCHGPAGLVNIKLSNGEYLVKNKNVTGFTNDEETAVKLNKVMPFLLETRLKELGAQFICKENWKDYSVASERLVTGQNPQSANSCAQLCINIQTEINKSSEEKEEIKEDEIKVKSKINILLVVTSHDKMGKLDKQTGWYLPEVAHPYHEFTKKGYNITIASPKGGLTKSDPGGNKDFANDEICKEFTKNKLNDKMELDSVKVSSLKPEDYDVIFYAGGHGTMWDFPDDEVNNKAAQIIYENGGIVSAVCHGPAALVNIKLSNGEYLVNNKNVTGFTNDEEEAVKLTEVMPFLLESKLKERGAIFVNKKNWSSNAVVDGRLITGQNPASATECAKEIIKVLESDDNKSLAKYDFTGKLVLVTGSTNGIGKEIAERYVASNANVIINSRKEESVNNTVNELKKKYNNANIYGIASDISKADGCDKLINEIKKIGYLDILVNNVGIFFVKPFETVTDAEWLNIFNVNVMSLVRLSRHYLPIMLKNKRRGGNIVTISSEAGVRSLPVMIHYSMTKSAQISVTRGMAELTKGSNNVRVNTLLPGPTLTEGVKEYLKGYATEKGYKDVTEAASKYFEEFEPTSLKQKFLDPKEIANACLFISSNESTGINGASLRCEGGIIRSIF